jgi:sugar phosphate isomerase/epimerase
MKQYLFILLMNIAAVGSLTAQSHKVGTSTALWTQPTVADLRAAKEAGLTYVEVALNQCYRGVPESEIEPRMRALKSKIDSAGLVVWSVHLPYSRTLDISLTNDEARNRNLTFQLRMVELCAMFRPARLVQHPSSEPIADSLRDERIAHASRSIAVLKEAADKIGAQLCVENLPRTCLGNTPEELLRIMGNIPGVGICFDVNHLLKCTHEHFFELAGHKIATIHLSDYDGTDERHWLPTQGNIRWGAIVRQLDAIGYDGVFMYEARKDRYNTNGQLSPQQLVDSFKAIVNDKQHE